MAGSRSIKVRGAGTNATWLTRFLGLCAGARIYNWLHSGRCTRSVERVMVNPAWQTFDRR